MNRLILGLMINLHLRGAIAALHALEAAQSKGFGQSSARVSSISDWRSGGLIDEWGQNTDGHFQIRHLT